MEKKKCEMANLEKKRSIFFQVGLIISIALALTAFEWSSSSNKIIITEGNNGIENDEPVIPRTFRDEKVKPPLPKTVIEIVIVPDDKTVVNDTMNLFSSEVNPFDTILFKPVDNTIENTVPDDDYVFIPVEVFPQFPGGDNAFKKFVKDNIIYPQIPKTENISGTVYVEFIVEDNGNIILPRIKRGVDYYLDKEALRLVTIMPKWIPAIQAGKKVKSPVVIPIKFILK